MIGHFLSSLDFWQLGMNPAFVKSTLDNIFFNLLDRDRRLINTQHACGFTGRGANPAGEFWKVIGRVQLPHSLFPASVIDQVIPVRNQVVNGTSGLAERDAAVHAARALRAQFLFRKIKIDIEPIVDTLCDGTARSKFTRVFEESRVLTHGVPARPELWPQLVGWGYKVDVCGLLPALAYAHGERP